MFCFGGTIQFMNRLTEVVDGPVSDIPLTSRQLGMLAAAEFEFYFSGLPTFEPKHPGHRPVLDTHIGTWVNHADDREGYLMLWDARPETDQPENFQIEGMLTKAIRDREESGIVDTPKSFEIFSKNTVQVTGARLQCDFDDEELLIIQHIARKEQKNRSATDILMDKFVVGALISDRNELIKARRQTRRRKRS